MDEKSKLLASKETAIENSVSTTAKEARDETDTDKEESEYGTARTKNRFNNSQSGSKRYRDLCLTGEIGDDMYLRFLAWVNLLKVEDSSPSVYNGKEGNLIFYLCFFRKV